MAVLDLRLDPALFWNMTPAQLFYLVERKNEIETRIDARFGAICATILNLFIKKGEKAIGPLKAMGYDDTDAYNSGESIGTKEQSPMETALRFRIMQAGMNRGLPKRTI